MNVRSPRRLALITAAGLLAAVTLSSQAQNTPSAGPGPQAMHRHADGHHGAHRGEHMARAEKARTEHQERLKASLQLTAQQEPAWNAFVAAMTPPARPGERPLLDRDAWLKLSTPERLARMESLKAERDRAMAQRHDAIRGFYAQLTPAQQKAFDANAMGGFHRAGWGGHGHGRRG